jgi:CBS domain-containing protein
VKLLISSGSPNVVLLREDTSSKVVCGTFDYSDLNAYLLLVVGVAHPTEDQASTFKELAQKGIEGKPIPMKDVKNLGRKEPLVILAKSESLSRAVEIFGSGIHRVVVVDENSEAVGVLTQLRLVEFFWQNRGNFYQIESLFPHTLKDLDMGSHAVYAIK